MTRFHAAAAFILLAAASGGAMAQATKCAMVPENMRARCEEAMKVKEKCAGLEGAALKECQQKSVDYGAAKEDCGKLQGDAKSKCELHNRSMDAAGPCKGKAGAELEACVKAQPPAKPYN
jgi:hypothetical protein